MNYKKKVLNLYACLGGNRLLWDNCHVTAIGLDPELARMYQERFPGDTVIVADAHEYLLNHFEEYDFIWSSPPCPTHSRARAFNSKYKAVYPDMTLYQEIILLQSRFKGKWVVENVIPYYEPLIQGQKRGRHIYWANFALPQVLSERKPPRMGKELNETMAFCDFHGVDISSYKGEQRKEKIVRNLVDYQAGKVIFDTAMGIVNKGSAHQGLLF